MQIQRVTDVIVNKTRCLNTDFKLRIQLDKTIEIADTIRADDSPYIVGKRLIQLGQKILKEVSLRESHGNITEHKNTGIPRT